MKKLITVFVTILAIGSVASAALYSRVHVWASNEILTSAALNAEFNNILNNSKAASMEGYSHSVGEMQTSVSPGGLGTESLASSIADELARLRYVIKTYITGTSQWYVDPGRTLANLTVATADIIANAVTDAKIRLTNAGWLRARNAADNADINVIRVNSSNLVELGTLADASKFRIKSQTFSGSGTFNVPSHVSNVLVLGCGGGGGGGGSGGGATASGGGGGGNGAVPELLSFAVTPSAAITVTIGAGGSAGTAGANGAADGVAGGGGGTSSFDSLSFKGGSGGGRSTAGGTSQSGGTGATGAWNPAGSNSAGGNASAGNGASAGVAGDGGHYASGGTAGTHGSPGGGGGGGGGAGFAAGGNGGTGVNSGTANPGIVGGICAGGGGAGGQGANTAGAAGGAGGAGQIIVYWVEQ